MDNLASVLRVVRMTPASFDRDSPTPAPAVPTSAWPALAAACVIGLSFCSLDLIGGLSRSPGGWANLEGILPAWAVTCLAVSLLFGLFWFLIARPLVRWFGLAPTAALAAAGVLIGSLVWCVIAELILSPNRSGLFTIPSLTAMAVSIALSMSVYAVVVSLSPSGKVALVTGRLLLVLPGLLIAVALVDWWRACPEHGHTPVSVLLPAGLFVVAAACVALLAFRITAFAAAALLVFALASLLVSGSLALAHVRKTAIHQGDGGVRAGHAIPRIILITVDTLRKDALSTYDTRTAPTPGMDALARDSVVFDAAHTAASWTLPSIASLMTGLPPGVHGALRLGDRLNDGVVTLAERLREAGYMTGAVVENVLLEPRTGLDRGFQHYSHYPVPAPGRSLGTRILQVIHPNLYPEGGTAALTREAVAWVEKNRSRDFFFWIHYLDPHVPYEPPARFLPEGPPTRNIGNRFAGQTNVRGGLLLSLEDRLRIQALYKAEVRYVDENVGILVDALKKAGLYDDALIILTSDHGEEFWEHGMYEHGHSVYEELATVPLFVKLPRATSNARVETRISNWRIAPTILDLAGLGPPSNGCPTSPSLAAFWSREPGSAREEEVFIESRLYYQESEALIVNPLKLIRSLGSGREDLYDLSTDPTEKHSLLESHPKEADAMRAAITKRGEWVTQLRSCLKVTDAGDLLMDPATIQRLRSLGYIQ